MEQRDFTTSILVDENASKVFDAIKNVSGWWQGEIEGSSEKLNDEFTYRMKDLHFSKQQTIEFIPDQKLVWLVTKSNLSFLKNKTEWTGSKIIFEIIPTDNKTQVIFIHQGLSPDIECYGACSNGWTKLIHESLYSLITTGEGKEVF